MKAFIYQFIPPIIWNLLHNLRLKFTTKTEVETTKLYQCPVCKNDVERFIPLPDYYDRNLFKYRYIHSTYNSETMNKYAYSCPNCYSSDRNRLYALFLKKKLTGTTNLNCLDIAPSKDLTEFIKSYSSVNYRSADLYMEGVDDKVDITDMNIYEDNRFDFIICSHVLEHIMDDIKAMKEIYRILKPTGFAIIMVPINLLLENDYENPEHTKTPEERWHYFGQDDHVRLYSKSGFISKLKSVGFNVNQYGIDYFGSETFEKNGIHPLSVLYVVEK